MEKHPIENLMDTTLDNLEYMIDVNTIIGEPIETPDGGVVLTVSKVSFGFASGGSQFGKRSEQQSLPFGGGSGGGVTIDPVAFLVVNNKGVKVIHLAGKTQMLDKIIDLAPEAIEKTKNWMNERKTKRQ
jgi:sporulation protein YtfJ